MKKYLTPDVELLALSAKEDILANSFGQSDEEVEGNGLPAIWM